MTIEDYCPAFYEIQTQRPAPTAYEGKFVHIVGPLDEFLVLSPVEMTQYHAQIVQHFSRRRSDISSVSTPSGDKVRIGTPGWKVAGGGRFRFDREHRRLLLWGSSKAYGQFNGAHLREQLKGADGWNDIVVELSDPPIIT